jgi:hypothetical protein
MTTGRINQVATDLSPRQELESVRAVLVRQLAATLFSSMPYVWFHYMVSHTLDSIARTRVCGPTN